MWKYTSYLKKGLSHEKAGTPCQDSVIVKEDAHCIVAALADGLGSLKHSDVAASTATQTVWELFASVGAHPIKFETSEGKQAFAQDIVQRVANRIQETAEQMGAAPSEMDCTLLFVYISKDHNYAITGRLGDSAICVIAQDGSIAINDSNQSANGTSAILDKDAHEHMEIAFWDVRTDNIQGFILTSDGLDNELYRKGSVYVNKAAEDYFNAVLTPDAQKIIQEKIGELTAHEDSPFDDDISIAVINRADAPVPFPDDPTWLCTCGARNRLQDTYCYKCGKDFSILYQNVRFREHGGKAAFFLEINKRPEEEAKIIGLFPKPEPKQPAVTPPTKAEAVAPPIMPKSKVVAPVVPPVKKPVIPPAKKVPQKPIQKTNPEPGHSAESGPVRVQKEVKKVSNSEKPNKNPASRGSKSLLIVVGILCLVLGIILGRVFSGSSQSKDLRALSNKIDKLTYAVEALSKNQQADPEPDDDEELIGDIGEDPEDGEDPDLPGEEEIVPELPENILVEDGNVYYWGEIEDGVPSGNGILLKDGYYFIGQFVEGKKVGKFAVAPESTPTQTILLTFVNDSIIPDGLDKYVVAYDSLNLRNHAGLDSPVTLELASGDTVYRTETPSVTVEEMEWLEVVCGDAIGWVSAQGLQAETTTEQPAENG